MDIGKTGFFFLDIFPENQTGSKMELSPVLVVTAISCCPYLNRP